MVATMSGAVALTDLLDQAGAVMTQHDGRAVPVHYGSAAGELAVCVKGVGLSYRSDLEVLSLSGTASAVEELLSRMLDHGIEPGGAALESEAWWCRSESGDEVLLVCRQLVAVRLTRALRQEANRHAGVELTEGPNHTLVFNVIGRQCTAMLTDLGVFGLSGEAHSVTPFFQASLAGDDVNWLIQADTSAFALVGAVDAAAVWQAMEAAGRAHGISCVGIDSIRRYLLVERAARSGLMAL
jgi:glycine cleavage system aminomethyltransferase T